MYTLVLILFIAVCVMLIIAILLQSSKGEGLASTFGGTGGGAVFGQKATATFLSKATSWLASGFMILALILALISKGEETKVSTTNTIDKAVEKDQTTEEILNKQGSLEAPVEEASPVETPIEENTGE